MLPGMTEPVLVVGAGPAGACLARLLARAGLPVTLVEREGDFARTFRGEGLMPSGVDACLQMGLGPLLASIPTRELEAWDLVVGGRPVFSVPEPRQETGERAMRVIPQAAFLEGVVADASRHPGFRLARGVAVRDVVREGGRVAGVRVAGPEGERVWRAPLVVGCDGRASAVRKRAGLPLDLQPEAFDVLWFKMPPPPRLADGCRMLLMATPARQCAAYTSWDGRLQVAVLIPKGGYARVRDADPAELMAEAFPAWLAAHARACRDAIEGPVVLDVIVGRAPRWAAPGVLLLGDAAHPMSPVRAQGINHALRDAIVAANALVPALRAGAGPEALDAAAARVQAEREPEVARAQTLQHRDTAGLDTWAAPFLMALAGTLGPLLGRFDWAKRAWLAQQRDLRFGCREVVLRV